MYKVDWHHTFLIIDPPTQQNLENGALSHSPWPSGSFNNLSLTEGVELGEVTGTGCLNVSTNFLNEPYKHESGKMTI